MQIKASEKEIKWINILPKEILSPYKNVYKFDLTVVHGHDEEKFDSFTFAIRSEREAYEVIKIIQDVLSVKIADGRREHQLRTQGWDKYFDTCPLDITVYANENIPAALFEASVHYFDEHGREREIEFEYVQLQAAKA